MEEDTGELSVNEVLSVAVKLAEKFLNDKRIEMLKIISSQNEPKTITSVVSQISDNLSCPKSTVWANVNCLKDLGLIHNGRGRPVGLTNIGIFMLRRVSESESEVA